MYKTYSITMKRNLVATNRRKHSGNTVVNLVIFEHGGGMCNSNAFKQQKHQRTY
jgi:hypothetical protein